jgi:Uma2 family endonuclease
VDEYWLIDWSTRTVDVHRRDAGELRRVATLSGAAGLTSPMLPGFSFPVQRLWMPTGRDS